MTSFRPWKIMHVSVRERLPDLSIDETAAGLFVVLWCDSIPLGELWLPAALLPVTASQLAALVPPLVAAAVSDRLLPSQDSPALRQVLALLRPLETCAQPAGPPQHESQLVVPSISVAICTKNRPDALETCLSSMRALAPPPAEIVIVDNDPSSGLTRPVAARFPEVRYVLEPRPGLSVARNTAIRSCRGRIIAFTDDDVQVHPGWIGAIQAVFQNPAILAATGLVLPAELRTRAQYVFQREGLGWSWGYRATDFDPSFFARTKYAGVPVWQVGAGANMAFRREAFDRVGLFDERLGAGASGCSEDSELWYRLLAAGHRCRYEPSAVVFHVHRAEWQELSEQMYNYMRGHVAALLFQFDGTGHWGNIYRAFLGLPSHLAKLAFRSLKRTMGKWIYHSGRESLTLLPFGPQVRGTLAGYAYYVRCRYRGTPPASGGADAEPLRPRPAGQDDGA